MEIKDFGELINEVISTAPQFNNVDGNAFYSSKNALVVSFKDDSIIGIRFEKIK